MRTKLIAVTLCGYALVLPAGHSAQAQAVPELPAPSPHARVEQRVGLTDLSVDYSSPAVKGRTIWGALVAYDKPWRTGANAATKLTASREFTFGGKKVPAGSYALYTIPGKASWSVVLSSDLEAWGDDSYNAKKDVAKASAAPEASSPHERLGITFEDTTDDATQLTIAWEKVRVRVPIAVDTKGQAKQNIDKAVGEAWRPHYTSARYLMDNGGDLELAQRYIEQSIAIKPTWWNHWVLAQLQQKKGRAAEAAASAEKAMQLGKGDRIYEGYYKAEVSKAAAEWKK